MTLTKTPAKPASSNILDAAAHDGMLRRSARTKRLLENEKENSQRRHDALRKLRADKKARHEGRRNVLLDSDDDDEEEEEEEVHVGPHLRRKLAAMRVFLDDDSSDDNNNDDDDDRDGDEQVARRRSDRLAHQSKTVCYKDPELDEELEVLYVDDDVDDDDDDNDDDIELGVVLDKTRVAREFPANGGQLYFGTVTSYFPAVKTAAGLDFWQVRYDDGDSEDMTSAEL